MIKIRKFRKPGGDNYPYADAHVSRTAFDKFDFVVAESQGIV